MEDRAKKIKDELKYRASNALAQGFPSPNSKRWTHFPENYPAFAESGRRCYIKDFAGREYTDFICGLGSISIGYADKDVTGAAILQAWKGNTLSLPSKEEIMCAESIQSVVKCAERVRFLKSGNEATLAAVRIARALTKRSLVLSDGYHGHGDLWTRLSPPGVGVTDSLEIQALDWNTSDLSGAACIIVEALKLDDSPEYRSRLVDLRQRVKRCGCLFVLDEVVTGFRVPEFTVSNWFELDPDIVVLGKGMANGFELSAVCGKKEAMDVPDYFISSTFSGSTMALAACQATIAKISQKNLKDLMFYGKRLQSKLNALHPDIKFEGYGTRAMLNLEHPTTALFAQEMCNAGVIFGKAFFYNFSHLEEDIESRILNIAEGVISMIKEGQCKYQGDLPNFSFKRNA